MKALIVVDMQNDFMPGGALPVPRGDEVVQVINKLLPKFDLIIFTKDWHPENHSSFASQYEDQKPFDIIGEGMFQETLWPDHCVQNTFGADLHRDIDFSKCKKDFYIFKKGDNVNMPGYSAFGDLKDVDEDLGELVRFLDKKHVDEIFVCGLATDFCVRETAIDAAKLYGYNTRVIIDACRGISNDLNPTLQEFLENNIKVIDSDELDLFNALM